MTKTRFKIRFFAFLSSIILSFSVVSADYLEVQALEWAATVVSLDTALKFLLGLVGVTVGVGVAEEIDWYALRSDCMDMQIEKGNSQIAVSRWWSDVAHGTLDQASSCWTAFKDWVSSLLSDDSSSFPSGFISGADIKSSSPVTLNYTNSTFLSRDFDSVILENYYNSTLK